MIHVHSDDKYWIPLKDYDRRLKQVLKKSDDAALPPLDIPMHPDHFVQDLEIGDKRRFNDIYIEAVELPRRKLGALCFGTAVFFWGFVLLLWSLITAGDYFFVLGWLPALLCFIAVAYCVFAAWVSDAMVVRFNRQAQMIHCGGVHRENGSLYHDSYPWNELRPTTSISVGFLSGCLRFYSRALRHDDKYNKGWAQSKFVVKSTEVFFELSERSLRGNLQRLEFLRRYMAEGLDAVQPTPGVEIKKPNGWVFPFEPYYTLTDKILYYPAYLLVYILGFGPFYRGLIEWRIRNVKWHPEVERLCQPGADLTGYDTEPVKTVPGLYYQLSKCWDGVDLVDRNGAPVLSPDEFRSAVDEQPEPVRSTPDASTG